MEHQQNFRHLIKKLHQGEQKTGCLEIAGSRKLLLSEVFLVVIVLLSFKSVFTAEQA